MFANFSHNLHPDTLQERWFGDLNRRALPIRRVHSNLPHRDGLGTDGFTVLKASPHVMSTVSCGKVQPVKTRLGKQGALRKLPGCIGTHSMLEETVTPVPCSPLVVGRRNQFGRYLASSPSQRACPHTSCKTISQDLSGAASLRARWKRSLFFYISHVTMIMQRVIIRHFPLFDSFELWSFVRTTLNSVSCFMVFPRPRLERQL